MASAAFDRLYGFVLGHQATWVVDIGLRAGLFRSISEFDRASTSDDLADRLGFDRRLTGVWCRAAFAYGVLDLDGDGAYRLPDGFAPVLLDPTSSQYLGGRIPFIAALYEDFHAFPELLRSGRSWPRSEHDPWLLAALANLTRPDAAMLTGQALPNSPAAVAALEAGGDLLEIGSGAGHHLVHYARTFPRARIVGIEPDGPSVALARAAIAEAGVEDRVTLRQEDANELDDAAAYDVAVMSITLHETGAEPEWANVLKRTHRALRPGGTLIVSELPYPDSVADYRSEPVYQMLAGVQLHEAVVGCGMITQGELGKLIRAAGFDDVRVVDQPLKTRHVVLGER
jgi:SAM-dependent methyltransferase